MSRQFDDYYFDSGEYTIDSSEWIPCAVNPNYYVCREGFVMKAGTNRLLKLHRGDKHGHINVRFYEHGQTKEYYVHRLVAEAFVPNPHHYPYVRHLDDDPENNHADNLVWGTQKENHRDCVRNGNYHPFSALDREINLQEQRMPIYAFGPDGEQLYFESATECARVLGLQQANIWKVLHGQRKHTCGYRFEYAPKEV